ncbi:MAG TPA: aminotransferase class IV [Oscillatoriales cyanobacterium M59_W2019_021]|nr:MAG: 4-amino-4-deoxychorismate lyase [Cyanobacteria bacterium J055]HIK32871.1 aminotransferase class IV [Oscillatoriales cyanobacterium M4454_W2019_049]HIK53287.1 aminotransferase class IV [Oscillatoriales cyanobacterium M59_W2019_021]
MKPQSFWYDGNLVSGSTIALELDDPGWLYGATVFTTLRIYDKTLYHPLTCWTAHRDRLSSSIAAFGWQPPHWERLLRGATHLSADFPVLRVTLFPDGRELITGRSLLPDLDRIQKQGITAWIADSPHFRRSLPDLKTGNYLGAWLALQTARTHNAREAILIDEGGNWLETSTGNLWGWGNGCWRTPPEGGILPGIGRSSLLEFLRDRPYPVIEEPWTPEVLPTLEAIAYTNSVVELVPIHTVLPPSGNPLRFDPHHPSFALLRQLWQHQGEEGEGMRR